MPLDVHETVFAALAHAARRRILMTVNFEGGEMTAGAIALDVDPRLRRKS